MRKAEAKKYHFELWRWLAGKSTRTPSEWPKWDVNGGPIPYPLGGCFPCEVVKGKCGKCAFKIGWNSWWGQCRVTRALDWRLGPRRMGSCKAAKDLVKFGWPTKEVAEEQEREGLRRLTGR
jgi:hypothetical protein